MNTDFENYKYAFVKPSLKLNCFDACYSNTKSTIIDDVKNHIVFINYDYKNEIEPFENKSNNPLKFPDILLAKVEKKTTISDIFFERLINTINLKPTVSKESYLKKVNQLKDHIRKGDIYEINYCITFEATDVKINPFELFQKLNDISKAPFACLSKIEHTYIISSSPELFISKKGNTLITKPIKGTAKRGSTEHEDELLKNNLQNSLKEKTENVMIVDVCRNDLSKIAQKGSVDVPKLFDVETFKQVHQMVSTVSCQLKEVITFKDIIDSTFPMASMTGAPKIRAMQLIDEFEIYNRGPYSGAIGCIDDNGDFDLSVLIRSIFYDEEKNYLSFSVGSAITNLCDAEEEYEECLLKAKAMIQVLTQ